MKKMPHLLLIMLFIAIGCSTDAQNDIIDEETVVENENNTTEAETEDTNEPTDAEDTNGQNDSEEENNNNNSDTNTPLTTSLRTFIFGHSLLVHDPPLIATPSNETTVPHWMAELSAVASFDYAVAGQYGFLPQHDNLPPFSQWGFDSAAGAWDSDNETFAEANFNSILLTAGNFIQYQSASTPYDGDNPDNTTPLGATLTIFDWVNLQAPEASIYIYENWPDMAPFLANGVPASSTEFTNYNNYTLGEFHQWWLNYHVEVSALRPDLNVKMIPVGPIISKLLTETNLSDIPFSELYEDDAPHGRPTVYFLAGLVTYMAMYGTETPADFEVPDTVHELVRTNYNTTVDFIWNELNNFNDQEGNSIVFQ